MVFIAVYLIRLIILIVDVLILIYLGIKSSNINEFQLKYRTHLRIINSTILILLAIYLLIF